MGKRPEFVYHFSFIHKMNGIFYEKIKHTHKTKINKTSLFTFEFDFEFEFEVAVELKQINFDQVKCKL